MFVFFLCDFASSFSSCLFNKLKQLKNSQQKKKKWGEKIEFRNEKRREKSISSKWVSLYRSSINQVSCVCGDNGTVIIGIASNRVYLPGITFGIILQNIGNKWLKDEKYHNQSIWKRFHINRQSQVEMKTIEPTFISIAPLWALNRRENGALSIPRGWKAQLTMVEFELRM